MTSHNLQYKRSSVGRCCRGDGIDCLQDTMQGGIHSDGHICFWKIVVYSTDQTNDSQMFVLLHLFLSYVT